MLMKMQGNEVLAKQFLTEIQKCWVECVPLENNNYETLKELIENDEKTINIYEYEPSNEYGEYDVEFLYVLMQLLAVQEKTNRSDAHMFGDVIDQLLKEDRDIFRIVSTAGFKGG